MHTTCPLQHVFQSLQKCVTHIFSLITSTSKRRDGRRRKKPTAATGRALRISWTKFLFSRLFLPWAFRDNTYMHFICCTNYYCVCCSALALVTFWCMLIEVALLPTPRSLQSLVYLTARGDVTVWLATACCPTKSWIWSLTPRYLLSCADPRSSTCSLSLSLPLSLSLSLSSRCLFPL